MIYSKRFTSTLVVKLIMITSSILMKKLRINKVVIQEETTHEKELDHPKAFSRGTIASKMDSRGI